MTGRLCVAVDCATRGFVVETTLERCVACGAQLAAYRPLFAGIADLVEGPTGEVVVAFLGAWRPAPVP